MRRALVALMALGLAWILPATAAWAQTAGVTANIIRDGEVGEGGHVCSEDWFGPPGSTTCDREWILGAVVTAFDAALDPIGSATWVADGGRPTGFGCGGVTINSVITLGGCGDTFSNPWVLDNGGNETLGAIEVDLRPAGVHWNHWFDLNEPSPGTPDSALGREWEYSSSSPGHGGTVDATYSFIHAAMIGDLWQVMFVDLRGLFGPCGPGGLCAGSELVFYQDTDTQVPVPGAALLLLTGLAGLAARRRA